MNSSLESTPSLSASALENCTGDQGGGACAHGGYGLLACAWQGKAYHPRACWLMRLSFSRAARSRSRVLQKSSIRAAASCSRCGR